MQPSIRAGAIAPTSTKLFLLLAVATLAGCDVGSDCSGKDCVKGSGKVVTQTRQVGTFTAIRLDSIGDLTVEPAGTNSLTVTTDDNLQPIVTSEVKDGTLVLAEQGCHNCSPTR